MRRLLPEELEAAKDKFVTYLITQGIDADAWQEMKKSDIALAEYHIDTFSHIYFKTAIQGITHLIYNSQHDTRCIACYQEDATEIKYIVDTKLIGQKTYYYGEDREAFVFELLEKGYNPTTLEAFMNLARLYASSITKDIG